MSSEKVDPTVEQEQESNPRHELHDKMESLKEEIDGHLYLDSVFEVNKILIEQEKQIGPNMVDAVNRNLEDIRSSTGSLPTYHAREVHAMIKDGAEEIRNGNYEQAALNGAGAIVNSMAFFASAAHEAAQIKIGRNVHGTREEQDDHDHSSSSDNSNGCTMM